MVFTIFFYLFILIFFSVSYSHFIHYLFNLHNIKAKVRYNNGLREFVSHHAEHIFIFDSFPRDLLSRALSFSSHQRDSLFARRIR